MAKPRFQFNQKLWSRFIKSAQPYFFPVERRKTRVFAGLILTLLVTVIAFTFFFAAGLSLLGQSLFPDFFGEAAQGLVDNIDNLLSSPAPYILGGVLFVSALVFGSQRQNLRGRWVQWVLLGALLFLLFSVNGLNVILSFVFRFIDTSLNQRDEALFWQFLIIYGVVIVAAVPIIVAYRYIRQKLGLLWREWLTKHFLDRYFQQRAYYQLDSNSINTNIDNPDQRISQDIKSFTSVTLDFLLDILDSVLTLISFSAILYSISKPLTWGLLAYAVFGTAMAILVGQRLININYEQLRLEANFRYGMVRVRDNAESIAFYRGEQLERQQVIGRLMQAIKNFDLLIIWQSLIVLFQLGYNYFTRLIPYIIIAPLYLAGNLDFGVIAQATVAFSQVLGALSLVTNQIQGITEFAASINRLGEFDESLDDPSGMRKRVQGTTAPQPDDNVIKTDRGSAVVLADLTLSPPNSKRILIKDLSVAVDFHDNLLIMGASGSGKSSLLRAIAGLWDSGRGTILRPELNDLLFLPQRPYMILGTLREQLLYPQPSNQASDDYLQAMLETVNLPDLARRYEAGFEAQENWENVLSLGEQQRVAFARILINQPKYAILDEATSALDVQNEEFLYQQLSSQGTTYISVGHRPTLTAYHQQLLEILDGGEWSYQRLQN